MNFVLDAVGRLCPRRRRGRPLKCRETDLLDGMLWILRTGAPWACLPREFGAPSTVHRHFLTWARAGVFRDALEAASSEYCCRLGTSSAATSRRKALVVDTSLVKSVGGRRDSPSCGPNPCDRGRLGSKIGLICDEKGMPMVVELFPANRSDFSAFEPLWSEFARRKAAGAFPCFASDVTLYGDRGFDSRRIRELCRGLGIDAVIPERVRRRGSRATEGVGAHGERRERPSRGDDSKVRIVVEHAFGMMKNARRLRSRFERTGIAFLGFVQLAFLRRFPS